MDIRDLTIEETHKQGNKWCQAGFGFGIASIFFYELGLIPLVGIIISLIGLVKLEKEKEKGLWMGVVGLVLNGIYMLMNMHANGHI